MPQPNNFKLKISSEIKTKFPEYNPIIFYVSDFVPDSNNLASELLKQIQVEIKNKLNLELLDSDEQIIKWRQTYKAFGSNPRRFLNSYESLLTRVLKGSEIPSINPIVDLYNYISLKYRLPIGGENWNKLESDLTLRFSNGAEPFDARDNGQI